MLNFRLSAGLKPTAINGMVKRAAEACFRADAFVKALDDVPSFGRFRNFQKALLVDVAHDHIIHVRTLETAAAQPDAAIIADHESKKRPARDVDAVGNFTQAHLADEFVLLNQPSPIIKFHCKIAPHLA